MSKAREQYPDLFKQYQSEVRDLIGKAAPQPVTKSDAIKKFESLIDRVQTRECSRLEAPDST
jgi:hypothetical protein